MIKQAIANWDGRTAADIKVVFKNYRVEAEFIPEVIQLLGKKECQKGASWLLKYYFEQSEKLSQERIDTIYSKLLQLESWETKLHILQSIPYMPIVEARKNTVEQFLRECLVDQNKFIRAWTYNGFYELSVQFPEYQQETKQFFEMAMRDEAASVKARIRNIMKKGF